MTYYEQMTPAARELFGRLRTITYKTFTLRVSRVSNICGSVRTEQVRRDLGLPISRRFLILATEKLYYGVFCGVGTGSQRFGSTDFAAVLNFCNTHQWHRGFLGNVTEQEAK